MERETQFAFTSKINNSSKFITIHLLHVLGGPGSGSSLTIRVGENIVHSVCPLWKGSASGAGTSSAQLTPTQLTGLVILIKCVMDLCQLISINLAFRTCCKYLRYSLCILIWYVINICHPTHLWLLYCLYMKIKLTIKLTVVGFPPWTVFHIFSVARL